MSWETYVSLIPQSRSNGVGRNFSRYMDSLLDGFLEVDSLLKPSNRDSQLSRNVSLREENDALIIEVEAPRFEENDFDISLTEGKLTLKAERSIEEKTEDRSSKKILESWSRVVSLPFEVDEGKIDAQLSKGILTIKLPKLPQVKPEVKKIAVHG